MGSRFSLCLVTALLALPALGADLDNAPAAFMNGSNKVIPVDMSTIHITYALDVAKKTATAEATVKFHAMQDGQPMFDLVPEPISGSLDGEELTKADLGTIATPDKATTVRKVNRDVTADSEHELVIRYNIRNSDLTWSSDGVRVGFFMSDLDDRQYFEQYGPANYEYDQIHFSFDVKVTGTTADHEVFTNGALTSTEANSFSVDFPSYFTSSSLFFHITKKGYFKKDGYTFTSMNGKAIPVTVYSSSATQVSQGLTESKKVLEELEATYGAFAHDRVMIYLTIGGGGMEYCGATMTSLWALSHELTHSWFARGVMPSNGNTGWIDEAIASWRDDNYPRASGNPTRGAVNLGGFSSYKRFTTQAAYTSGESLMSEFDYMARNNGGLKPILKNLFAAKQRQTISLPYFKSFMETSLSMDLTTIWNKYVFGKSSLDDDAFSVVPELKTVGHKHPRPFTKEELARFR